MSSRFELWLEQAVLPNRRSTDPSPSPRTCSLPHSSLVSPGRSLNIRMPELIDQSNSVPRELYLCHELNSDFVCTLLEIYHSKMRIKSAFGSFPF